jgi:hypothetical protein
MADLNGIDGRPLRIEGVAAVAGATEQGLRVGPRAFIIGSRGVRLGIGHADGVNFADLDSETLELWHDERGSLCFAARPMPDRGAAFLLNYLGSGARCSYLGAETIRQLPDGTREIYSVELEELTVTMHPFFAATACWRSDADNRDLPRDVARARWRMANSRREPLPDMRITAQRRPPSVAPASVRASARGSLPERTCRCTPQWSQAELMDLFDGDAGMVECMLHLQASDRIYAREKCQAHNRQRAGR